MRTGLGAAALTICSLAGAANVIPQPAHAQYGYGGYDRPRSDSDEYEPRRRPRYNDEYDRPRRRDYDEPRGGGGFPQARGGFVQSCRNIEQDGAYLSADCRMRGGGYRRSRIDVRTCRSIANLDGRLVCER
jgi:hypothetical protein